MKPRARPALNPPSAAPMPPLDWQKLFADTAEFRTYQLALEHERKMLVAMNDAQTRLSAARDGVKQSREKLTALLLESLKRMGLPEHHARAALTPPSPY